ncbi:class I SAM-dependent methyltransferase [Nocardioides sp. SYSU D00038]|uniref:class I SAM-dependent methyltransferase n=1 Tax=Nocardioides sp. SYSU D00038 TaxID=2812554 RepID=UPI001968768E|nr:class I SAM-dependent methyltransferase [Nocardioides sp. SYSU D00038]
MTRPDAFDDLARAHPWPAEPPHPGVAPVGRPARGFELIARALAASETPAPVVLEIGAEFGGSTRRFLGIEGTRVVSVDPWPDWYSYRGWDTLQSFRDQPDAFYELFLTFNFEHRDRLVPIRRPSPEGLIEVHDAGLDVDLVYIDGDHRFDAVIRDLDVCHALFPGAMLTGDDWEFTAGAKKYEGLVHPTRLAVQRWAQFRDHHVEHEANTWLIDPARPFNLEKLVPSYDVARPRPRRKTPPPPPPRPAWRVLAGGARRRLRRLAGR